MPSSRQSHYWQLRIAIVSGISRAITITGCLAIAFSGNCGLGQITPDATLGGESSSVTPNVNVRGLPADLIEGGAARGANLFHSFSIFNVGSGQRVYFANPAGIQNILSRVTGTNPSNILGTLGVNGGANLFLLNPNGIIFGPNAKLDIAGSFVASTADSLVFENGYKFSATNPDAPPLLTVNLTPGLQYGSNQPQATITNSGNLAVGHNLMLSAGNLDLQGQLLAGGDLTLLAQDTLKVRDRTVYPFIASARGQLLVQGDRGVDIFALNHPNSGFFSGRDMVLRSANTVGGDAHYTAAGSFRIEQLDGSLGNLFSPHDPIIRANGDVAIASYRGASLHILAGGLVFIPGTVRITGSDTPANSIRETIALSDGTAISIDGNAHPTLDVRAGTTAFGSPFVNTGTPTSADILIGAIAFTPIGGDGGRVFLTNQYQPHTSLGTPFGGITVGSIDTKDVLGGGSVTIDARSEITLVGTIDTSAVDLSSLGLSVPTNTYAANGGDVTLLAKGDITLNSRSAIGSFGLLAGNIALKSDAAISVAGGNTSSGIISGSYINNVGGSVPTGGDITITARSLSLSNSAAIFTLASGQANAGSITITATDSVSVGGTASNGSPSATGSFVFPEAEGNGGNLNITTRSLSVTNGARLGTSTLGRGNAGNVTIVATDSVSLGGFASNGTPSAIASTVETTDAKGNGGNVDITTGLLSVTDGAFISTNTKGQGDAGSTKITATDAISFDGVAGNGQSSGVSSEVYPGAEGNGGNIDITARSLSVSNGAILSAATAGKGDAGDVTINASDWVSFNGVGSNGESSAAISEVSPGGEGNGGNINITTGSLFVTNGAALSASTQGKGDAGNVTITASDTISFDGFGSNGNPSAVASQVSSTAEGNGGNINITTGSLSVTNGAALSATTGGKGDAGNVTITASDTVSFDGVGSNGFSSGAASQVYLGGEGNGGNVNITARSLSLTNGAQLSATTLGVGDAGNVTITASDTVSFDGVGNNEFSTGVGSEVLPTAQGNGGNINITTGSLSVTNGAQLSASTAGQGNAGNITINASDWVAFDGVGSNGLSTNVFTQVFAGAEGKGGDIDITARSLSLTNGAVLNASTAAEGNAGNVRITATDAVFFDGVGSNGQSSGAGSQVFPGAEGNGGNIDITARSLSLTNGAILGASTVGQGNAGNVRITATDVVFFDGVGSNGQSSGVGSEVLPGVEGNGGNINITTGSLSVSTGAFVSATTAGQGNAGNVTITARDAVSFDGVGSNGFPSGVGSQVYPGAEGVGGNINITARSLSLTNGAALSTSTFGQGDAGNIRLNATEQTLIREDAQVLASTLEQSSGKGGSINITTGQLDIQNSSQVAVNSQGSGIAGNIQVTANSIRLDNQSAIKAEASSQDGGNIELGVEDLLLLRRNSQISTTAGTAQAGGNGGNITIDTEFIVAIPQENSDITANAFEGRGGRVEVTAQGLFGIEPRSRLTPLSDITASSARGPEFNGVIEINTPDVDLSRGLRELPTDVVDASQLIDRRCTPRGGTQERSSFTITGRGGLPPSPNEPLRGEAVVTNWVTLDSDTETNTVPATTTPRSSAQRQLVEAQGWVINEKGQVVLTASAPNVTPQRAWFSPPECNPPQSPKAPQS